MRRSFLHHLLQRLARVQTERPWLVVLLVALTLLPAGYAASRLELRTAFSELLPTEKPSVVELQRVKERLSAASTLTVTAEGRDAESLKRFVDAVAPRLRALPPELVTSVDDGTREVQRFFEQNKHLYADLEDIRTLHAEVLARYDHEVGKAAGFDLGLDLEDEQEAPPELTAESLEQRFAKKIEEAKRMTPGLDGYYIGENGKFAAILVRTPLSSAAQEAFELKQRIEAIVDEVNPKSWDPTLTVGYTGNLITSAEQHRAITQDLMEVGMWGVGMILGVVFLFFLRVRTLFAMAITIAVGCLWSFAFAELTVGYLNTATGFLVSIIAGNGINFGIIYMARFIEARREERLPVADAIRVAHADTHTATLAAAGAAMVAYGSLAVTDFHGFKHFGIIGGTGMMLCWAATYLTLPAVLVISERYLPMFHRESGWRYKLRGLYGYPFALLARRFPKVVAIVGVLTGVAAAALTVRYFADDPMDYDLANVRNERLDPTSAGLLSTRVDKIVGRLGQDGRAILTDRLDQVKPLVAELEKRRGEAPPDRKPFQRVVSIYDLLPQQQTEKLELLAEIQDRLERARERGFVTAEQYRKIEPHLPEKLGPIVIADLPEQVARAFTEKDGTRGRILYIVPTEGRSMYDARYLLDWADSFREVTLPNGELIRGTGDPVIFADMLINVAEDAPQAILVSLLGTIAVVLAAFRGRAAGWAALATLLLGMVWLVAFLALFDIKLNFLNFVVLPIGIGIGADYIINVLKRRQIAGDQQLFRVLVETGGAVVLCSLTTVVGYLALLMSINRAVKSFGLAAAVSELTTVLAAVLVLPAVLFWMAKKPPRPRAESAVDLRTYERLTPPPPADPVPAPPPSTPPAA